MSDVTRGSPVGSSMQGLSLVVRPGYSPDRERLRVLLAKFSAVKVMAVGDIYLDENIFGKMTGVSLEAPIPVFEVHERRCNPGAAGNAACNAASLGGQVFMVGVIGDDANGGTVVKEFHARGVDTSGIVVDAGRATSTYGKLRAGGHSMPTQEVLRMDTPKPSLVSGETERKICEEIRRLAPTVNAILLGDQVSSTLSVAVLDTIRAVAKEHGVYTVADSRKRAGIFLDIDIVKPNDVEAGLAAGIEVKDEESLRKAGLFLLKSARNAMITRGPKGITVFSKDGGLEHVPCALVEAVDVTGAGDTVAAAVILTMATGGTLAQAATLGNMAASIAVVQKGVVTVSNAELLTVVNGVGGPAKLKTLAQLRPIVESHRREGRRVVWTNGCFDILHPGHIAYLSRARQEGDVLVVGLNSDASVSTLKGPERPVVNEHDRATVMSALACVDYLIIFSERTPLALLKALTPEVYAKGGDYTIDTIVQEERHVVESYGGSIAIIPGVKGRSTTNLIARIKGS